jgi:SAM-dependent methyltransferase
MSDGWFDEDVAETYDADTADTLDPAVIGPQLDLLAALADGGRALEFAIGTGRIAIPLASRGVPVAGIELSRAMVARLRAKPGGDEASIPVAIGDMTSARAEPVGGFSLVYLVFNTVMNVTSQDGQVEVFANAARHLSPGGRFLIETGVPDLRRLPPGARYVPFDVSETHVGVDEYDPATQRLWSHHVTTRADGRIERSATPFRYVWPSELDLMARIAGMTLDSRWADWTRAEFTSDSPSHVSVWRKARQTAFGR